MELYDMHTHILPKFDDGAKSVEVSLSLIDALKKQGVHHICLTPHFYTNEMSLEDYLIKRQKAYEAFVPYIPNDVEMVLGCEVYVTDYMFNNSDLSGITYGKSHYMLTEFAYNNSFSEKTFQKFYMLTQNYGIIPVIPHVERYGELMSHPNKIERLKELGVVVQTNVSNFTQNASFFTKRRLLKLIDRGLIDILGTDTHSMQRHSPEVFGEAVQTIKPKCGARTVGRMMHTAKTIFTAAQG